MKQKLIENRFVQDFSYYNCSKTKAIAGSANKDSEKSFTYLNSYRVCMLGGEQTKENPNS